MKRKHNALIYLPMLLVVFLLFANSCKKDDPTVLLASLKTSTVTDITATTATSGGEVTMDGGADVTERGICWGTSANPTIVGSKTINGKGKGLFTCSITGLVENTTYYVRAYATNSEGTAYGNELSFVTVKDIQAPTLTTTEATEITQTTAVSGGNVTSDGGGTITERGICYSTSQNPTTENSKTTVSGTTGKFIANLSSLTSNKTYYIRAYATNSKGTVYGNELSFVTLEDIKVPTLTTSEVTEITQTTAVSGGDVTNDGGGTITERGVCYSTTQDPTITDSKVIATGTTGAFTSNLSGLTNNVTYYVRAYATNSAGTAYGNETSFIAGTVKDIDGNLYHTVTIGTQVWMVENLKATKFNDGTPVANVTSNTEWMALTSPGYCWYDNDISNKELLGALYSWYAISIADNGGKNICPEGWHVPSIAEWDALRTYLGGNTAGGKIKEAGTAHWDSPNTGADNSSGFTALPTGFRYFLNGTFTSKTTNGEYWSTTLMDADPTIVRYTELYYASGDITLTTHNKLCGFAVRCIKD